MADSTRARRRRHTRGGAIVTAEAVPLRVLVFVCSACDYARQIAEYVPPERGPTYYCPPCSRAGRRPQALVPMEARSIMAESPADVIRRHLAGYERLLNEGRDKRERTIAAHMAVALRAVLAEGERLG